MKDLDKVEQEMYYTKCKKMEDKIRQENNPEQRKKLQQEYEMLRSHLSMKTLMDHMKKKVKAN